MRTKHYAILGHFIFWVLDFLRCYQYTEELPVETTTIWITFNAIFFYLNYFVLIPYLFKPDKISHFFLWGITYLTLYTIGTHAHTQITSWYTLFRLDDYNNASTTNFSLRTFGWSSHLIAFYGAVSTMSRLFYDRYHNIKEANLLIEKKSSNQINTIRANMNTPFFVETLQIIKSKSKNSPANVGDDILQLSSVLRHGLYETSKPYISLEQEIEITRQYIALIKSSQQNFTLQLTLQRFSAQCPPNFIIRSINHWLDLKRQTLTGGISISITQTIGGFYISFPITLSTAETTKLNNQLAPASFPLFDVTIQKSNINLTRKP